MDLTSRLARAIGALVAIGVLSMHGLPSPAGVACHQMGPAAVHTISMPAMAHGHAGIEVGIFPAAELPGGHSCVSYGPRSTFLPLPAPAARQDHRAAIIQSLRADVPASPWPGSRAGPDLIQLGVSQQ